MTSENTLILLIEDNEDDVLLTRRAIRDLPTVCELRVARDGQSALGMLDAALLTGDVPGLVFLDLNLPGMDGFGVLRHIRSVDALRCLPVIALTTSHEVSDVRRSYALGANSYIRKPVDYQEFVQTLDAVMRYWTTLNELPDQCL
jgi:two-component system response regulator